MKRLLDKFELPLFARELTELAAKKRTYVIRVAYAAILFWIGLAALSDYLLNMNLTGDRLALMGSGRVLFSRLLVAQMAAVHIFMPALACAAITTEKERNTLGLLLLTRLGPWRILFEKLFSRLLPMLTCLLLSVPILALSYTLGGLTLRSFVIGTWLLLATCIQVACLTLMCSAFFRSTVAAFIASYAAQILMFFAALMIDGSIGLRYGMLRQFPTMEAVSGYFLWETYGSSTPRGRFAAPVPAGMWEQIVFICVWKAKGIYLTSLVFFGAARLFLIRRATVVSRSRLMRLFKGLDRFFVWLNQLTGGVTLVKDVGSLPDDKPIAWREVTKKSLGTARYLFRVFLVLELPTTLICVAAAGIGDYRGEATRLAGLACALWAIAALIVTIKAATLVAAERASETLDVLLTTTLTSEEIIRQKCAGLTRVLWVTAIPLLTVIGFGAYMKSFPRWEAVLYTVWGVLQVLIYLPLIAWIAVWVGLRMGSQTKSIFASMALLLFWIVLPGMIAWGYAVARSDFGVGAMQYRMNEVIGASAWDNFVGRFVDLFPYAPILLSGPTAGIALNELDPRYVRRAWFVLIPVHTIFFGSMWFFVRRRVLAIASRKLGRAEAPAKPGSPDAAPPSSSITDVLEPSHAMS